MEHNCFLCCGRIPIILLPATDIVYSDRPGEHICAPKEEEEDDDDDDDDDSSFGQSPSSAIVENRHQKTGISQKGFI
jgi:hypothetical protein